MGKKHKPRSGSLAFYPRKRAKKETPSFRSAGSTESEGIAVLNFLGYKAGMTHVTGKNMHEKSPTYGQTTSLSATVVETPPMKVFGIRAYKDSAYGPKVLTDVFAEKTDNNLLKRIKNFKQKKTKKDKSKGKEGLGAKKEEGKEEKAEEQKEGKKKKSITDLEGLIEKISEIRLVAHAQPAIAGISKKKPEIVELILSGNPREQLAFAKKKLGNEISIEDVFKEKQFIDVKAVTKGKGFQGIVKRAGVKMHRPKAKHRRTAGSIGPWHPATVMWTVARPGQMGYHTRTEYNKKILKIGSKGNEANPSAGFSRYGVVKSSFIILAGSIPGPSKRAIGLRTNLRKNPPEKIKLEEIDSIAK